MAETTPRPDGNARLVLNSSGEHSAALLVDANRLAPMLDCSVRSVRKWDAAGMLPAPLRIGGRVLWRLSEIEAWIEAGAPPRDEWEKRKGVSQA